MAVHSPLSVSTMAGKGRSSTLRWKTHPGLRCGVGWTMKFAIYFRMRADHEKEFQLEMVYVDKEASDPVVSFMSQFSTVVAKTVA